MKNKISTIYKKLPTWCRNRYFLSVFCFCIWIFFFDTNSILTQIYQTKEINKIKQDQKYYKQEIEKDQAIILDLVALPRLILGCIKADLLKADFSSGLECPTFAGGRECLTSADLSQVVVFCRSLSSFVAMYRILSQN